MSHQYRHGGGTPHHIGKSEEVYRQNPKNENHQHELVNDWVLDLAQAAALRDHDSRCDAKYEEWKKHRVEVVQYLSAMRGWAMETTKTIRQLEKRTRIAEKEAAASKAEVLRLQALLSKKIGNSNDDLPTETQKKRRKKRSDSDASSVQQ